MADSNSTVRVPRAWVFMVMGASVLGAALAAIVMVTWLVPRLSRNEAARANTPQTSINAPGANQQSNNAEDTAPLPEKAPPPVKPPKPPMNREAPPKEEFPPPVAEEKPAVAELSVGAGCAFRVRPKGGEWVEGNSQTRLGWNDRIQVRAGMLALSLGGLVIRCNPRSDLELIRNAARDDALVVMVREGRLLVLGAVSGSCAFTTPVATLRFISARFVLEVWPERCELSVAEGSIDANLGAKVDPVGAATHAALTTRVEKRSMTSAELRALEDEFRPPRETLLFWDFDGERPCTLGKLAPGGALGSAGSLAASPDFAAIGSEKAGEFKPDLNSRLRFWVKTNAPAVRISFGVSSGAVPRIWVMQREMHASEWQLVDVPLVDFVAPAKDVQGFAGHPVGFIQFRMRFPDRSPVMPSEQMLLVDDVEIYTPK
jgi:hypothetical protein